MKAKKQRKSTKGLKSATKLGTQKPLSKGQQYLTYTMSNTYVSS